MQYKLQNLFEMKNSLKKVFKNKQIFQIKIVKQKNFKKEFHMKKKGLKKALQ